jgi:hypothetical protein
MRDRLLVAMALVLALVVSACDLLRPSGPTPGATSSTVEILSDSAIQSLIIVNIKGDPNATAAIPLDATRAPDILVHDGVLTVATTDPASAASLCRTVAGMTNSPDTGAPLGITEVVIIVPVRQTVARCSP